MELAEYRAACVFRDEATEAEVGELQDARDQDARDIALCAAIKARGEAGMPHDVFMASVGP